MHFPIFFILPLLFSTCFAQQLISLNSFNGNNIRNPLVDTPFSIYVSAHSDDDSVLKEVFVISGNASISLYDLKTNYFVEKFGQLERYVLYHSAYLTSPLATLKLAELTGVMYLSSPEQVADDNFYVYDIDQRQDLNLAGLGYQDLTILFLNTNMATNPPTSTLISNWTQNSNSRVYLYQGVPYGKIDPARSHIFSNPMMSDKFYWYFPNVETFSISTVSFYIRAYNGTASFILEPGSTNLAGTTTTDVITTGFYMKPKGIPDSATQINVKKDVNYDGFTGCNIVGHVPNGASVSFDIYNGDEHYNRTVVPTDFFEEWSTPNIGDKIVISSTNAKEGVFYVQYFIIQGASITTNIQTVQTVPSVPSSTSTAYPDTTTKESRGLFGGLNLIIFLSILFSIGYGQQLISLSTFQGEGTKTPITADLPYSIYISAHSDSEDTLRNVFIVSGKNRTSLFDLKNNRLLKDSSQLAKFLVTEPAYVTSLYNNDLLQKLSGVMFISSSKQVADNSFCVFDVDTAQNLGFRGLGALDLTILFLNTNTALAPVRSSLISSWDQNPDSLVYIYQGIPRGVTELKNSQIFSNPMMSDHFNQYFPNVETFSIATVAFYFRTYKGGPNFRIEPGRANLAGSYTTAYTTTGFHMKPLFELDAATLINVKKDPTHSGSTGCNILGYDPLGTVTFNVYDGGDQYKKTTTPTDFFTPWSTPHVGDTIVISNTNSQAGQYYVQYFVVRKWIFCKILEQGPRVGCSERAGLRILVFPLNLS
uniref:CUB_2 domain-containing protein n=1 Tax=Caenorhabditis tropicalis TaxID=1561998 RepID=A0A1I7UBE0_9PELO